MPSEHPSLVRVDQYPSPRHPNDSGRQMHVCCGNQQRPEELETIELKQCTGSLMLGTRDEALQCVLHTQLYERGFSFLPLNNAMSATPDTFTTCNNTEARSAYRATPSPHSSAHEIIWGGVLSHSNTLSHAYAAHQCSPKRRA
eukprot:364418-Chlamydomonas_euryale.AAC.18